MTVRPPDASPVARARAMDRARSEILAAAADLVAEAGLRGVTMAALARRARVAKATVYNHFRDRDDVVRALLMAERDALLAHCATHPDGERLDAAARWIGAHRALGGLRAHDPAVVIGLATAALSDPAVTRQVAAWTGGVRDAEDATRWLVSFAVAAPSRSRQPVPTSG